MTALPGLTRTVPTAPIEWGAVLTATETTATVELDRYPGRRHGPYPIAPALLGTADAHTHPRAAPPVGARVVVIGNPALANPLREAVVILTEES